MATATRSTADHWSENANAAAAATRDALHRGADKLADTAATLQDEAAPLVDRAAHWAHRGADRVREQRDHLREQGQHAYAVTLDHVRDQPVRAVLIAAAAGAAIALCASLLAGRSRR